MNVLADTPVVTLDDLATVLAPGDGKAFTRHLLAALETSTRDDRARLARLYPRLVTGWRWWRSTGSGTWTASRLRAELQTIPDTLASGV
jgi:hypothetical protein